MALASNEQDDEVALVEQMLALHRQRAVSRTPQEQTALSRQITATDTQIDRLVYDSESASWNLTRVSDTKSK